MTTIYLNTPKVEATLDDNFVWTCEIASIEQRLNWLTARMYPPPFGTEHWIAFTMCKELDGGGKITSEPEAVRPDPKMIY